MPLKSKQYCKDCCDLPEGKVVKGHDHTNDFDLFIRQGLIKGFTDEQLNFLADWLEISDGSEYKK